jgi:hypothetical protein
MRGKPEILHDEYTEPIVVRRLSNRRGQSSARHSNAPDDGAKKRFSPWAN